MKLFVWDFHGVLEKGNDQAVLAISNQVLEEFGYFERLTLQEAEKLTGLRWHQYFSYLLPYETEHKHLQLQKRCFEISYADFHKVKQYVRLNDGAKEVLEEIKQKGHKQILVSNTSQEALERYIHMVGIEQYFSKGTYFGIDTHFHAKNSKKSILREFLQKNSCDTLITIGDSPADMELADLVGNSLSFLYSYPHRPHREAKADYKIHFLKHILDHIE